MFGKSIRMHLRDGTVTGIKSDEISNQVVQATSFPRLRIGEISNNSLSKKPGEYFLLGIYWIFRAS